MGSSSGAFFLSFWGLVGLVYAIPTMIAVYRHANSVWSIAALNMLLGWTLIMWFGAWVWAITDKTR